MIRGASRFLLKADISQFYPSLYTHAVGWAIDPQLREPQNWRKSTLLGKRLDQELMNAQGKVSQGIPIGNDVSYLLAEVVLGRVDRSLKLPAARAYRWYDDYEIGCDSREDAEKTLLALEESLREYNLRLNPQKTSITTLPKPVDDEWKLSVIERSKGALGSAEDMVQFFDVAFSLRERFPEAPVLLYATGVLFRLRRPTPEAGKVAESSLSQALLAEPGCAQKVFALLSFWAVNGLQLDRALLIRTIGQMLDLHRFRDASSDVAWALSFCLEQGLALDKKAGRQLSRYRDSVILLLGFRMEREGLLPEGFELARVATTVLRGELDGEGWLLKYESVRHGFVPRVEAEVKSHFLFSDMLSERVTFLRAKLPMYAGILQPGGAPPWVVTSWLSALREPQESSKLKDAPTKLLEAMAEDVARSGKPLAENDAEAVLDLLDVFEPEDLESLLVEDDDSYSGGEG